MRTKLIAAAVTALALVAPPARAGHVSFDCGYTGIDEDTAFGRGETYTTLIYGYIVSDTPGEPVSLRCYLRVDGTEVPSVPVLDTGNVFVSATRYTASVMQDVDLCADWTAGAESGSLCYDSADVPIPPEEVVDFVRQFCDLAGACG